MWFPNTSSFSDSLHAEISLELIDSWGGSIDRDAERREKENKDRKRLDSVRHKICEKGNISGLIYLFSNGFLAFRSVCSLWKP